MLIGLVLTEIQAFKNINIYKEMNGDADKSELIHRLSMTLRQTAKMKLLPSVFSSLYSRIKIFAFAVTSKRHFSIFV